MKNIFTFIRDFFRLPSKDPLVPASHVVDMVLGLPRLDIVKPVIDLCLILIAAAWAWLVSFGQVANPGAIWPFLTAVLIARGTIYFGLLLHRTSWLHVSRFEVLYLFLSAVMGPPVIAFVLWILPDPFTLKSLVRPFLLLTTEPAFYLLVLCGSRMTARAIAYSRKPKSTRRVLIIGAGSAARALALQVQEVRSEYHLVGFLDDDPSKKRVRYRGLRVLGGLNDLSQVTKTSEVQDVIVAITHLPPKQLREIMSTCKENEIPVRILPPLEEIMGARANIKAVREVRMEDLLPRPEVDVDRASISSYVSQRTVVVTGGGGSIGGELCRQVVNADARRLIVLGRGENSVFEMVQELKQLESPCEIIPAICDVRDRPALNKIFEKFQPEVVFHAAAHKHVPLMEQYPCEAIKNNVGGTLNLVQLAVNYRTEHFVMVSTDKAVDPANVMGASKRVCEMIVKCYAERNNLNMVCVRFGNVLGSRGSVVPTMARQIRHGLPVTVTDPDMVRYFMTIPEAVQLILQAGSVGGCGEVFVLDMGRPVRILDLAHDLIRLSGLLPDEDIPIIIIGKRPGEKMYEDMLMRTELSSVEKKGPFFMAMIKSLDFAQFSAQLESLIVTGEAADTEKALKILRQMVPEFKSPTSDLSVVPQTPMTTEMIHTASRN